MISAVLVKLHCFRFYKLTVYRTSILDGAFICPARHISDAAPPRIAGVSWVLAHAFVTC